MSLLLLPKTEHQHLFWPFTSNTVDQDLGLQDLTVTLVNDDLYLRKNIDGAYKGYDPPYPMRYLLNRVLDKPIIS